MTSGKTSGKRQQQQQQEILDGFNGLRNEQRAIASKIYELENDLGEHKIVIDSLQVVSDDRKCYRLIGGVLVERTVKQVLPELNSNSEKLMALVENLNKQLIEKGKEILDYKEKNNIQFQLPPGTSAYPDQIVEEDETAG